MQVLHVLLLVLIATCNAVGVFLDKGRTATAHFDSVSSALGLERNHLDDFLIHNLSSSGKDGSLQKFWTIAFVSYVMAAIFAYGTWWWFYPSKEERPPRLTRKTTRSLSLTPSFDLTADYQSGDDSEDSPMAAKNESRFSILSEGTHSQSRPRFPRNSKEAWVRDTLHARLQTGALTLLLIGCLMVVYMMMRFWDRPLCAPFRPWIHIPEMMALALMMALTIKCIKDPSPTLYWPTLLLWFLYIPACQLPPFNLSCTMLEETCQDSNHWRVVEAVRHADCSLHGQTAQQIFLTVFLLLPWLLPERRELYLMWVWIAVVYVFWSVAYMRYSPDEKIAFSSLDIIVRTILLSSTLGIAFLKKHHLERSQRNRYLSDQEKLDNSMKLYSILQYMLPDHVIPHMLMNPGEPWSEPIECATIMFIVIDDFDTIVQSKSPSKLLQFLNQVFTRMDEICKINNVTKIETVGEEYVCCVGVMPADQEASKTESHSVVLGRLLQAASDIMALQTTSMQFKMGMHTGPIVAGVIGNKLPRFRLFGDTINTSARMMQKGVVGQVQFGDATHKHLPEGTDAASRGMVEMKGKGQVATYLFAGTGSHPEASQGLASHGLASHGLASQGGASQSVASQGLAPLPIYGRERGRKTTGRSVNFEVTEVSEKSEGNTRAQSEDEGESFTRGLLSYLLRPKQEGKTPGTTPANSERPLSLDFSEVVNQMQAREAAKAKVQQDLIPKSRLTTSFILSEKDGFTPEMEETWFAEYMENTLCSKLHPTIDKWILGLFIVSVVEFFYMFPHPDYPELAGWHQPHSVFGTQLRLPIFIACRICILAMLMGLRFISSSSNWIWEHPTQFQVLYVVICSCAILLLYLSYDVMIVGRTVRSGGVLVAPLDQIFSLTFVLMFFLVIRDRMLFYYSLAYIPLSLVIVGFANIRASNGVYFPLIGQVLFVIIAISNSVLSHAEEQSQRSRFKARHATDSTKTRVQDILKSMMPHAVLAEVRKSPAGSLPSHLYEAATIAQSDLCGFTALASTRTPREIVEFVSELFGLFDDLASQYSIYKVETIGDAYIAGQAERPLTTVNSPTSVIRFGIGMVLEVIAWSNRRGLKLACRVGVHHGACLGGIVGADMQRYHIFGALMQGLEVLESTAPEGRVQVSSACHDAVLREWEEELHSDQVLEFKIREGSQLVTSKGEVHSFDEVGGCTYVVQDSTVLGE